MPPSIEEVEKFAADPAEDSFEQLVDRLLATPQYGERWGRHWLDVARYADSGGYETDIYFRTPGGTAIRSSSRSTTTSRMTASCRSRSPATSCGRTTFRLGGSYVMPKEKIEHLEARVATGLYALGPQIHESNMDGRKLDYERLTDWVDTTGAAFLGLTLGCAGCHDHKFDPISQRDYYACRPCLPAARRSKCRW